MSDEKKKKTQKNELPISGLFMGFKGFNVFNLLQRPTETKLKEPARAIAKPDAEKKPEAELPGHAIVAMTRVSEPRKPERLNANPDMEWVRLPLSSRGYLLPANPKLDGVEHINVNIRAETRIGQMLSHFWYSPFVHPMYGKFANMEAFWQWLKSKERPEAIRTMSAANAKKEGQHLDKRKVPMFYEAIADANYLRVEQNLDIYEALMKSDLPFDTYYLNPQGLPTRPQDSVKMIKQFEQIREWFKNGEERPVLDYEYILYNDAP